MIALVTLQAATTTSGLAWPGLDVVAFVAVLALFVGLGLAVERHFHYAGREQAARDVKRLQKRVRGEVARVRAKLDRARDTGRES